jgi:uncharacterized membrane protein YsdA (DUF1294 family)/cold shock CspA family protein
MHYKGRIASWKDEKGFGFISPNKGGKQLFVHIKAFNRNRRPEIGATVTYSLSTDRQGRPCAAKARLANERGKQKRKLQKGIISMILATLFLALVGACTLSNQIPSFIFYIYVVASLLTFIIYAVDKSAAQRGAWRTKESTLHLLAIVGGWPGALIAQQKLRHKSQKQPFRSIFWITVLLNCGAFVWLFTPTGSEKLQSIILRIM